MDDLTISSRRYASTLTDIELCRIVVLLREAGYMPAAELHDTVTTIALHNPDPGSYLASMPEMRANNYFESYFTEIEARGGLIDLCREVRQSKGGDQVEKSHGWLGLKNMVISRRSSRSHLVFLAVLVAGLLLAGINKAFGIF